MKVTRLATAAAAAALIVSACSSGSTPSPSAAASAAPSSAASAAPSLGSKGTLKVGVTLPLSGGAAADGQPTLKGAQLAIDQANAAGGIGGYKLEILALDHSVNGKYNEQQGAQDMQTFVGDAAVFGLVGPYNSAVAKVEIPIGNDAGLLQCSPANTNQGLTKPEFGGMDLRKNFPDRIAYIRVAATDDIQGPAMSDYAYNTLGLKNILVIHDVTTFGKGVADNFQKKWEELGGAVADRVGAGPDTTDFNGIITAAKGKNPDGVYYGGVVTSGAGLLLKQMRQQGLDIPFTGPDGIVNGPGDAEGSLIGIAGGRGGQLVWHRGGHRRLPSQGRLHGRLRGALQGRRRLQYPRRVQRPRACLRDGHPRVAPPVPRDEP
jgi:branched-chain amino acid transport system substrate-binding protein